MGEKEYEERKKQKDFEDKKEIKKQKIENDRLKRKRRRDKKEDKKEKKKMFLNAITDKQDVFKKDIPLIEQLRGELGDDEYNKLCVQEVKDSDQFDYNDDDIKIKGIKRNKLDII